MTLLNRPLISFSEVHFRSRLRAHCIGGMLKIQQTNMNVNGASDQLSGKLVRFELIPYFDGPLWWLMNCCIITYLFSIYLSWVIIIFIDIFIFILIFS